jgi:cell division protein FtsL
MVFFVLIAIIIIIIIIIIYLLSTNHDLVTKTMDMETEVLVKSNNKNLKFYVNYVVCKEINKRLN